MLHAQLLSHGFSHGLDEKFGCAVNTRRGADLVTCNGVHVENLPGFLFKHEWQHSSNSVEVALDVHIDHFFPILHGQIDPVGKEHQAGVVDQDVHCAIGVLCKLRECSGLIQMGNVCGESDHLAPGLTQLGNKRFQPVLIDCCCHDASALCGQCAGGGSTNAGRCASDDGDLVLQITHIQGPLCGEMLSRPSLPAPN